MVSPRRSDRADPAYANPRFSCPRNLTDIVIVLSQILYLFGAPRGRV